MRWQRKEPGEASSPSFWGGVEEDTFRQQRKGDTAKGKTTKHITLYMCSEKDCIALSGVLFLLGYSRLTSPHTDQASWPILFRYAVVIIPRRMPPTDKQRIE